MYRLMFVILGAGLVLLAGDLNDELLTAARKGDLASVKALLQQGAMLEAKTPYGQTPLYLAAMSGREEVVAFLLDKGANAAVRDTFYKAPILGLVLERKHYGVAKLLITRGKGKPDEELPDVAGSGNAELVEAVLAKGKPSQPVLDLRYEVALAQKQTAIAELLKKAGAREPAPAAVVEPEILASYAGTYKTDQVPLEIKVFVRDGKLYMQATGQSEFAPKPKSPTSFELNQYQLQIEFDSSASFTLKQAGREFKFKKVVGP